jgi:uncharacterized membrane protein
MNKRKSKSRREIAVETDHPDQLGLERLIFFSDAVFAIAITLLTLDIRLPSKETLLDDAQLFTQLIGMWHEYLAYLISFLVIGVFWMAHHRKYRFIKRYNSRLMLFNLLFLMVVVFIPFPSSIISKYSERTATIFYALTMALAGLLLAGIWWYASHRNRLVAPDLDARIRKREYSTSLTTTTIFLLSIGISFWNADIGRLSWLLLLPASMVANRN